MGLGKYKLEFMSAKEQGPGKQPRFPVRITERLHPQGKNKLQRDYS